ncbi:MAG: ThiF family adenylyltransferase [Phycisphaerales bacterium]|nr:ThiF family adenylyltransferase [Phycisphaerales bacterium]
MTEPPPQSRYHRQTILPGFGPQAEAALAASHVMIVGMGALGCPAADLLARAGIGTLSLVDRDLVELTNLQRQTLYSERDVGRPKAEAAAARLREVNRSIRIHELVEDFAPTNADALLVTHPRPHVVLDCTDNFQTRYLINDACVKHAVPLVYGGAVGSQGVQLSIRPGITPCLRCLFPDAPAPGASPTCDTAGIFAPVSAIIGATQAADAIKLIVAPRTPPLGTTMLQFDLWSNQRTRIDLKDARDAACPCCGRRVFDFLSMTVEATILCGRNAVQLPAPSTSPVDLAAVAARLASVGTFTMQSNATLTGTLSDGTPLTLFKDGRAIVGNTTDAAVARSVYARYVGL